MINRILTFIIGVLCGAIITTICFIFYIKGFQGEMNPQNNNREMFNSGEMMEPPNGEMGEPPQMPNNMPMNPQQGMKNYYRN